MKYQYTASAQKGFTKRVNDLILSHSQGVITIEVIRAKLSEKAGYAAVMQAVSNLGYYQNKGNVYRCQNNIEVFKLSPIYVVRIRRGV